MLRSPRTRRRRDAGARGIEPVDPFVSAVDVALRSLRGRTRVSRSTASVMFARLGAAVGPGTDATVDSLVQQGLDEAGHAALVPTPALVDRLLDLRSAAMTCPSRERGLVVGAE